MCSTHANVLAGLDSFPLKSIEFSFVDENSFGQTPIAPEYLVPHAINHAKPRAQV